MRRIKIILFSILLVLGPLAPAHASDFRTALATAQAAMRAGAWQAAWQEAAIAWSEADSPEARVAAARLAAAAHFQAGNYLRAEYWLRLARQAAPNDTLAREVASDYNILRRTSPYQVQLNLSLAPSSNINNGSQADTVTIWGLPFVLNADARPLSGWEASVGGDFRYRLNQTPVSQTVLGLSFFNRSAMLSREAKRKAPDVKGSDFNFAAVEVQLLHRRLNRKLNAPFEIGLRVGKTWYGKDPLAHYARLNVGQEVKVSPRAALRLGAGLERQFADDSGGTPSTIKSVSAELATALQSGSRLSLGVGFETTDSSAADKENRARRVSVAYAPARPVLGANLSLSVGYEFREYDYSPWGPDGRVDRTTSVAAKAAMPEINYYGFMPIAQIEAHKSQSNIDLFDRESWSLRFGLESKF